MRQRTLSARLPWVAVLCLVLLPWSLAAGPAAATGVVMPMGPGGTILPTLVFLAVSPVSPAEYDAPPGPGPVHARLVPYPSSLIPYPPVRNRFGAGPGYITLVAAFNMAGTWHPAEVTAVWRNAQNEIVTVDRTDLRQVNDETTWVWYVSRRLDRFGSNIYHVAIQLTNRPYRERARLAGVREGINIGRVSFSVRM
ncbi:MAG: hypothetical protein HY660_09820 [Armatimonadetes bacterium]|nr:hypothetical protein [Armatimonadota bacterium]